MEIFAKKLKERAERLGISNAEAARRAELDERRYAHYASGREPDLATLVKIARALGTSPNWLLGVNEEGHASTVKQDYMYRLMISASALSENELRIITIQTESLAYFAKSKL